MKLRGLSMELKIITYEQLIAGSLLLFGQVDPHDLFLLENDLPKEILIGPSRETYNYINWFFVTKNNFITLNNDSIYNIPGHPMPLIEFLQSFQGEIVAEYINQIDLEEFVLRKIVTFKRDVEYVKNYNKMQQETLVRLMENGSLIIVENEDNSQKFELTQKGKVYLYKKDYFKPVNKFYKHIWSIGYDVSILDAFLMIQDLDQFPREVLNLDDFIEFAVGYNKALTLNKKNAT